MLDVLYGLMICMIVSVWLVIRIMWLKRGEIVEVRILNNFIVIGFVKLIKIIKIIKFLIML